MKPAKIAFLTLSAIGLIACSSGSRDVDSNGTGGSNAAGGSSTGGGTGTTGGADGGTVIEPSQSPVGSAGCLDADPLGVAYAFESSGATGTELRPILKLENRGSLGIPLSSVSIRYWFSSDDDPQAEWAEGACIVGDNGEECQGATATVVPVVPAVASADSYLEVSWPQSTTTLDPNMAVAFIRVKSRRQDWAEYDFSNDWSYDPTGNAASIDVWNTSVCNPKITAYIDDELAFGQEPTGISTGSAGSGGAGGAAGGGGGGG